MIYGYARVSTDGQEVGAQVAELKAAGAAKVFSETASGSRSDRRQLARAIAALGCGDTLLVVRLDRLARSTADLVNTLNTVADRGALFRSLRDPWADITTPQGRLLVSVLSGLAEFELELIKSRTGEGRARAMANGVRFGRPPALTPQQVDWVAKQRAAGVTIKELARTLNKSRSIIGRIAPYKVENSDD